jgi:molybdate transport system substrate-binding protein
MIRQGKLTSEARTNVAKSGVGAAVRAGAAKPDLSSRAALKASLLAAKAIVLTPGPSNSLLHQLFDTMGIGREMRAKEVRFAPPQTLTGVLIDGKADIAFSQISELIAVRSVDYAGPLPAGSKIVLTYTAALHAHAAQPEATKALVKFLTTPDAAKILKQNGLEPG